MPEQLGEALLAHECTALANELPVIGLNLSRLGYGRNPSRGNPAIPDTGDATSGWGINDGTSRSQHAQ